MKADEVTTILGIDPGTINLGFAIVMVRNKKPELVDMGNLNMKSITSQHDKLSHIYTQLCILIEKFKPDEFAIEAPFFGKNVQSMLKLGRAQGVCIAVAMKYKLITEEYSPRKIKQSVAGNGNASKEQVARMIEKQFNTSLAGFNLDATDALSVALCHAFSKRSPGGKSKSGNWSSFLKANPSRILE